MVRALATGVFLVVLAACGGSAATVDDAERDESGRIVGPGQVGTQALRAGDCFLEPSDQAVLTVTGVPCDRSHDAQVVARVIAADADEWPGRDFLSTEAATRCGDAAAAVLAAPRSGSAIGFSAYVPDDRSWRSGDRDIVCFVESSGGGSLEGDLLGSGA